VRDEAVEIAEVGAVGEDIGGSVFRAVGDVLSPEKRCSWDSEDEIAVKRMDVNEIDGCGMRLSESGKAIDEVLHHRRVERMVEVEKQR